MKTQKIKKHKNPFEFWVVLTKAERMVVCIPIAIAIVLAVVLIAVKSNSGKQTTQTPQAMREVLLETDGAWDEFSDYGISVWLPKDLPKETLGDGLDSYMKLSAQRDKGNYPELVLGTVVVPDTEQREFNIQTDQASVLDCIRPYLQEALAKMFNGVYPTISADIEVVKLDTGEAALQAKGEASCTVVFQDPKDPGNPYAEEVSINIYYLCKIFHGRPVIAWGAWDYSTWEGESKTRNAVKDAITSVMRADDATVVEPEVDDWNTVVPHYGAATQDEPVTSSWDEEKQAWVNDVTGEIDTTLPPPTDEYWDDKRVDPDETEDEQPDVQPTTSIPVDDVANHDTE